MAEPEGKSFVIDIEKLPVGFPTHRHSAEFWEALGRAVATFGFLEETLGKAIFAFTATRRISPDEAEAAFNEWLPTLERAALTDPLANLINLYAKAVRVNSRCALANFDELLTRLRAASSIRNVLCHGSWRTPDKEGRSLPLFVDKKKNKMFSNARRCCLSDADARG